MYVVMFMLYISSGGCLWARCPGTDSANRVYWPCDVYIVIDCIVAALIKYAAAAARWICCGCCSAGMGCGWCAAGDMWCGGQCQSWTTWKICRGCCAMMGVVPLAWGVADALPVLCGVVAVSIIIDHCFLCVDWVGIYHFIINTSSTKYPIVSCVSADHYYIIPSIIHHGQSFKKTSV